MTETAGRSWGYWTKAKLGVLAEYLDAFVRAASGPSERIYLDAFAGEGKGLDRLTGEEFKGSARIALEAQEPGFTRFRFFEKGRRAAELEARLRTDYPGRDIMVYEGDYKVELWMLFPSAGLVRTLALDEEKLRPEDEERASRLFGEESWRPIYKRRLAGQLTGADAREEYVNLMRWRLEHVLGYRWTHPLELKTTGGIPLYHMIFATDNEGGTRIMEHIYAAAARSIPAMRKEAADRAVGQQALDLGFEAPPGAGYRYEPPWGPPGSAAG
jgi:hypothetical protein